MKKPFLIFVYFTLCVLVIFPGCTGHTKETVPKILPSTSYILMETGIIPSIAPEQTKTSTPDLPSTMAFEKQYDVAAYDAPQAVKDRAKLICTGYADDKIINIALKQGAGSEITLSDGTYNIIGGIIIPSKTTLKGQGQNTKIFRTTDDSKIQIAEKITAWQTTFKVTDGSGFTPGQTIWFDQEYVYIIKVEANDLTVIRGHNASIVVEHKQGTRIYFWMEVMRNEKSQEGRAADITIQNLFIDGGSKLWFRSSPGITLRKCDNSMVENCWVQNVSGAEHPSGPETDWLRGGGIQADDSDNVVIANNYVTGTTHAGISFRNKCKNGAALGNEIWDVGYEGIVIGNKTFKEFTNDLTSGEGCEGILVKNNVITNCGLLGGSGGIFLDDQAVTGKGNPSRRITIENNTISSNNPESKMSGIIVFSNNVDPVAEWDFVVQSNTITNCTYSGVAIIKINGGIFEQNNISGCIFSGIYIADSKNIGIFSNVSQNNNEYGISIIRSIDISVDNNTLQNNHKGTVYPARLRF
jgi:parallel beta-helix repeat protein